MKHALLSKNEQLETHLHGEDEDAVVEEIKDTTDLQVRSLENFAYCLGYVLTNHPYEVNYFYSNKKYNKERLVVSVASMIKLHNGYYTDWHGNEFREPFKFNREQIYAAWQSKLVAKVKLQYSKKKHKFVTQNKLSHLVEFTKEIYQEVLL